MSTAEPTEGRLRPPTAIPGRPIVQTTLQGHPAADPTDLGVAVPELNGTFLAGYDDRAFGPDAAVAIDLHRRDQLLTGPGLPTLQAHDPGRLARPSYRDPRERPLCELILDVSNLLPFQFLRTGDRLGRAVVKIQRSDGASGTGFLVASNILLTNHHVLPDVATATTARALANYEASPAEDMAGRPAVVPLDPQSLFVTNADLDFTFCAVQGLDHLGGVPLDRNSLGLIESEYVNIVQHPRGRAKEVALQDNQVVKADHVVVQYTCDTEPGSSGSPVFNNQWKLVALHHASVTTDSPQGRSAATAGGQRYLNEGIRVSAIATWLETAAANDPARREQVGRLRAIFDGLDPQIGFFGALGRKAAQPGVGGVVESYRNSDDDLDIAYWDLRDLGRLFGDRLDGFGRVVADMNMDLWCFAHARADNLLALCDHLETKFRLEYDYLVAPAGSHPPLAIVYRRTAALEVDRLAEAPEGRGDAELPLVVRIRARTRSGRVVPFALVPFPAWERPPGGSRRSASRPLIERVARQVARAGPGIDWLLIGDVAGLLAKASAQGLTDLGLELWAASTETDGAIVLLTDPRSRVEQLVVSPNMEPVPGLPEGLLVARDRTLPANVIELAEHHPIALRLVLNDREAPTDPRPGPVDVAPPREASPLGPIERRLKDLLAPIIAELVAEYGFPRDSGASP